MAQVTYEVRLSLDGNHSVVVRSADPSQMQVAVAWAKATHAALSARYGDAPASEDEQQGEAPTEPPICGVHEIQMVRVEGKNGPFYSCHQRDDEGRFCTYRPTNGA
jgi:hypothetical protein